MPSLIRLRDQPGVGPLEWRVAQHGWTEALEERADELSRELFGIDSSNCGISIEEHGVTIGGTVHKPANAEELMGLACEWDSHFSVLKMYRDESDAFWAEFGWDVTDGEGLQLRVMDVLTKPLVCLVKQLHPRAHFQLAADTWGAKLEAEAKSFRPSRRP